MEKLKVNVTSEEWKEFLRPSLHLIPKECLLEPHYPDNQMEFNAFNACPFDKLSTVILGQDPYYTPNTANGLAFSCVNGKTPKSLQVIFNAIQKQFLDARIDRNPDLTRWANQGVLLLNTALTVKPNNPGSDIKEWHKFISFVILSLSSHKENLNWCLWGNHAKGYEEFILSGKVFKDIHPAARTGTFEGHFNQIKEVSWI